MAVTVHMHSNERSLEAYRNDNVIKEVSLIKSSVTASYHDNKIMWKIFQGYLRNQQRNYENSLIIHNFLAVLNMKQA